MKKVYEFVLLLSPEISEHDLRVAQESIEAVVKKHKGAVVSADVWGKRPLAYAIQKHTSANYIFFELELDTEKVAAFDRDVRLDTKIMRHLLVVHDKFLKKSKDKNPSAGGSTVEKAA